MKNRNGLFADKHFKSLFKRFQNGCLVGSISMPEIVVLPEKKNKEKLLSPLEKEGREVTPPKKQNKT